jgi:hypothetical protein
MSHTVTQDGAAKPAAPKYISEECFNALLNEVYERLGIAEGRLDDLERTRDAQDRRVSLLLERVATLERAT